MTTCKQSNSTTIRQKQTNKQKPITIILNKKVNNDDDILTIGTRKIKWNKIRSTPNICLNRDYGWSGITSSLCKPHPSTAFTGLGNRDLIHHCPLRYRDFKAAALLYLHRDPAHHQTTINTQPVCESCSGAIKPASVDSWVVGETTPREAMSAGWSVHDHVALDKHVLLEWPE